jgi:uncharacterized membrane protein
MFYFYAKLIHIVAVVLFLGNITTGIFWIHFFAKSRSPIQIASAMEGVIRSDRFFTIPAVLILSASGLAAAMNAGLGIMRTKWIAYSILAFALSGLLFIPLAQLQRRIRDYAQREHADWNICAGMLRQWDIVGAASLFLAWSALVMMVLKRPS